MATSISPLYNKSVLITGGAGFFGRAFVRRCLDDGARRVAIYSRDEAKHATMKALFQDDRLRWMVGDVRDVDRLTDAMRGVDLVVHAAAMKRVEVCEQDPNEATATNLIGTENVVRAGIANNVQKAVLTSTDKAAAPNTHYGSTKLCAEKTWNASNVYSAGAVTRFACCRYGNVTNSTGSVVPVWNAQKASGAITVTDPRMTRFIMRIEDAVDLVVLALSDMRGAEIFIPKLKAHTVESLANAVAPECEIRTIGIRPGEKLHEVLVTEDEARNTFDLSSHYVIEPDVRSWGDVPPLKAPRVPFGFEYKSSTAPKASVEELRRLVA
jgi:UDP-N-acetylglucosamine 4,6-dehydratase